MATLQTKCTKGRPITVIYPAETPSPRSASILFRVGKKTVLPAYTDANLPYLVQFQKGQRIIMFMLVDVLQTSFLQKVRNAYNLFGQLDIDEDIKVDSKEAKRIGEWLKQEAAARGVVLDGQPASNASPKVASETSAA